MSSDFKFCVSMVFFCLFGFLLFMITGSKSETGILLIIQQIYIVGGLVIGKLDEMKKNIDGES